MLADPIVALATPPGRSALAVVRLSGSGAFEVAASIVPAFRVAPAREARLAWFRTADGDAIDRGLYLTFPAPASYTGEDVVEFTCHGGLTVPVRLLAALEAAGARPASAGEFTRRAVLNGKLDLLQAEAVGDLIEAEVPVQVRAALRQLEGGLSRRIADLRRAMVELLALLAYEVDFPEEDDGPVAPARLEAARADAAAQVERLLATAPLAERVRRGAMVVLTGPSNTGKSSLFNALLGRDRAIVTDLPGTTRDAIEAHADFRGWPVRLVDTAGLGDAADPIDALGQEMARRYLDEADLVMECDDGRAVASDAATTTSRPAGQESPPPFRSPSQAPRLLVRTKSDLGNVQGDAVAVSALTGEGLDQLRRIVVERLFREGAALADLEPALTRERHRVALTRARAALEAATLPLAQGGEPVLAAHHVQEAVHALDVLVGVVDIEDVLDRMFATFCVGK